MAKKDQSGTKVTVSLLLVSKDKHRERGSVRYRNGCNAPARGLTLPCPFNAVAHLNLPAGGPEVQHADCLLNLMEITARKSISERPVLICIPLL